MTRLPVFAIILTSLAAAPWRRGRGESYEPGIGLSQTKASRKAYPSKFRHLVYADGTTGLHVLTGIPAGAKIAVKGRVVRPDGGRSGYAQAEIVV